ncbi:MAG: RNA polymerase sigma factor [Bacteroidetes bacterium]|nr:RNA polymerase sigma factor [Bacteroidota bacterium]
MDLVTRSTVALEFVDRGETSPPIPPGIPAIVSAAERRRFAVLPDADLVLASINGSTPAFDELVERYRIKVLRLVTSMLGASVDCEDVAQDIFVKVYLSLNKFRGDSSFSTYLYTVTTNRCRDELRRAKLRKFFSFDEWFAGGGESEHTQENGQRLDGEEQRDAMRRAMKRLPVQTQMLLHLREVEELSYKELADVFGVEIGTIKSRLARARDRLREEITPYLREGVFPGSERKH